MKLFSRLALIVCCVGALLALSGCIGGQPPVSNAPSSQENSEAVSSSAEATDKTMREAALEEVWQNTLYSGAVQVKSEGTDREYHLTDQQKADILTLFDDFTGWAPLDEEEPETRYGLSFTAQDDQLTSRLVVYPEGDVVGIDYETPEARLHRQYTVNVRIIGRLNAILSE